LNCCNVVRHSQAFYEVPKSQFHTFEARNSIIHFFKLYNIGKKIIKQQKIDYLVTFNPYPWGIVAWLLAKRYSIPVSVGLIGKDYEVGLQTCKFRWFSRHLIKTSDFVTITGSTMLPLLEK
ncbi:MAG: glycosyltransferase family 4 protein, partial [Bacteroidales bacterium]|nr:glycosyltransferase family 4 protein [Bacteroidales bacterium]